MIYFLRPYWFLALIPFVYLFWQMSKFTLVDNWRQFCDEHLLSHLLIKPETRPNFPLFVLGISGLLSIFALAGPSWHQEVQPIYRQTQGTVIVLNLSPSMREMLGTTTKIDRARFKILDYLRKQREGLTGLVVYTDEAHVISPLTEDSHTIANLVPVLDPNIMPTLEDQTAVGLEQAEKLFKQANVPKGNIVLVTDKVTQFSQAKHLAESMKKDGNKLYIWEISKQPGSAIELQELAKAGGGDLISLSSSNEDINALLSKTRIRQWASPDMTKHKKALFWHDDGWWIVLLLLPLALVAFRKGYVF